MYFDLQQLLCNMLTPKRESPETHMLITPPIHLHLVQRNPSLLWGQLPGSPPCLVPCQLFSLVLISLLPETALFVFSTRAGHLCYKLLHGLLWHLLASLSFDHYLTASKVGSCKAGNTGPCLKGEGQLLHSRAA